MSAPGRRRKRTKEIQRKNRLRHKIQKLKKRYQSANSEGERKKILQKLFRMSPLYPVKEFIGAK